MDYYDRYGQPISLQEWSARASDPDYKIICSDQVPGWLISTVWLGLDHSFSGRVQIFETMIFKVDDAIIDYSEDYCDRYATQEEAREGHLRAMQWLLDRL